MPTERTNRPRKKRESSTTASKRQMVDDPSSSFGARYIASLTDADLACLFGEALRDEFTRTLPARIAATEAALAVATAACRRHH
jgi:hypothetical protein